MNESPGPSANRGKRSVRETLRGFILSKFMFDAKPEDLDDGVSFLEKGIIDSTGVLELLVFLETQFGIEVLDTELVPRNLGSVDELCRFLERKGVAI